jgi:hypothetical protein
MNSVNGIKNLVAMLSLLLIVLLTVLTIMVQRFFEVVQLGLDVAGLVELDNYVHPRARRRWGQIVGPFLVAVVRK